VSDFKLPVTPSVRDLAHRLNVDLTIVTATGPDGMITAADVQRVHKILTQLGPLEKLTGARLTMAQTMTQARDQAVASTVIDDAVLHAWGHSNPDLTLRLIHALVAGVKASPAVNAWFDSAEIGRRVLEKIHLGIEVETAEGVYVCVMQDVAGRGDESLRKGLDKMKIDTTNRAVPPEELRGYTMTLVNYGMHGGRYATPVIVPPTVAVVAAGKSREAVVPIGGQPKVARILPLSVTFDHRAVTSGEAAKFLAAMIADLERAN